MTPRNEVKAKLFALYLNQDVYMRDDFTPRDVQKLTGHYLTESATYFIEHGYLLLRSIEQLTDEEILQIALMYGWPNDGSLRLKEMLLQFKIDLPCICIPGYQHKHMGFVFDYLRSIGVALPFTFLDENQQPQTASVSDQQSWGFIKLVEK